MNRRSPSLYPFDWLIVGYCLLMVLSIAVFGRPLAEYYDELIAYLSMSALALVIVKFVDESRSGLHRFVRLMYPVILFTLFYRETEG